MDTKQALLIYNPVSGKRKNHHTFPMLVNKLQNIGYRLTIYQLTDAAPLHHPIKKACRQKWDAVFIAGGDGTVNQIIQLLGGRRV